MRQYISKSVRRKLSSLNVCGYIVAYKAVFINIPYLYLGISFIWHGSLPKESWARFVLLSLYIFRLCICPQKYKGSIHFVQERSSLPVGSRYSVGYTDIDKD